MADMTIFPTGLTYSRNTKAPLMDMQVFETLALAQAYVDNKESAMQTYTKNLLTFNVL